MSAVTAIRPFQRRTRLPLPYLVVAAVLPIVLLAVYAAVFLVRSAPPGARIGQPAPSFALADLEGTPIRLSDLAGRPVILNFWASWCGPCVEEFPLLQKAEAEHRGEGLTVVGVVFQDRSEAARAFMQRMDAGWPAAMDPGGSVSAAYGVLAPPTTFFIGRDGTVVDMQVGQLSRDTLERQVAAILAKE